jgi:transcription-repair coupling factor (superfamily II helicase)
MLRVLSIQAGVKRLDLFSQYLVLQFSGSHLKNPQGLIKLAHLQKKKYRLTRDHAIKVRMSGAGPTGLLAETKNILKEIIQHVNSEPCL